MSEHDEQCTVFSVLRLNEGRHPKLKYIFAVPNGGSRHPAVAGKLKAEGVKRGVSDIVIPISSGTFYGAFLEMKFGKNKVTPEQFAFGAFVVDQGYEFEICYSADQALEFIEDYLGIRLVR